jgi:hypothetical protein
MAKRKQSGAAVAAYDTPKATPTKSVKTTRPKVVPTTGTHSKPASPSRPGKTAPKKTTRPKSRPTPKVSVVVSLQISERLREIRRELFGDHGGPELARPLNLPARTFYNFETGVSVPAETLLSFLVETAADPYFVLTGKGPKFRRSDQA